MCKLSRDLSQTKNMDLFENEYFRTARKLMFLIGRWPECFYRMKSYQALFVCITFLTGWCTLIAKLVTTKCDMDLVIEMLSPMVILCMCFTKYCTTWIGSSKLSALMEYMRFDWRNIKRKDEIAILKKYAEFGRLYGLVYAVLVCAAVIVFVISRIGPCIVRTIIQTNQSFTCEPAFPVEYFVDQNKYFYPISVHITVVIVITHAIVVATDWFFVLLILHACSTFSVLGYRLEHIFDSVPDSGQAITDSKLSRRLYGKIANCVQFHIHIKKYLRGIHSCYSYSYAIQLLLAVVMLTGLLLRKLIADDYVLQLVELLAARRNFGDILGQAVHAGGVFLAIFVNVFPGQILLNCSTDLFMKAYSGKWYVAPLAVQKALIILLRKTMEPSALSTANLISASLPTFSAIVQTSVSYFTVLYSVRESSEN